MAAAGYLYKPQPDHPKGGPVFLAPSGTTGVPVIVGPDGKKYEGRFVNDLEGNRQFVFSPEVISLKDATLQYGDQSGKITSGGQAFQGSGLGDWQPRQKGSIGSQPTGGFPGQFTPGQFGYGSVPAYLGGTFPSPIFATYNPIAAAPYQFTDPEKFAESFGKAGRKELQKNYALGKELALDTLDTELAGLEKFIPAKANLQRGQVGLDNVFNQAQRTQQIDTALPGVRKDLETQAERARTLASGRLPSSIEDRALEVGVRSKAADLTGGFGAQSSASRKVSDLLSADQRLDLSKYGDQLLTSNIGAKASLELAPTEYANAGSQINVNPTLSPSQLISSNMSQISGIVSLPTGRAFSSNIQQNQFSTGLEQQTRQFNAGNELQNSQFNAGVGNSFALQKFGYDVSYAGAVAGAQQTDINTNLALEQQQQYQQIVQQLMHQSQSIQQIGAIVQGISGLLGASGGLGGILSSATSFLSSLFGSGGAESDPFGISGLLNTDPSGAFGLQGFDFNNINSEVIGQYVGQAGGEALGTYLGGPVGGAVGGQVGSEVGSLVGPEITDTVSSLVSHLGF